MNSQINTDVPQSVPPVFFGESEARLLAGPLDKQTAEDDRRRLRGRFVHRHKGKSLRRHALRPIRRTYRAILEAEYEAVLDMANAHHRELSKKYFSTWKPKRFAPLDVGTSSRSMMMASELMKTVGVEFKTEPHTPTTKS